MSIQVIIIVDNSGLTEIRMKQTDNRDKKIKTVTITPGCTTCGLCEFIAPDVFEVTDISHVNASADVAAHTASIKKAAQLCPVQVIEYEESE